MFVAGFDSQTFFEYNVIANKWTGLLNTPFPLDSGAMVVDSEDRVVLFGGKGPGGSAIDNLYYYNISSGEWGEWYRQGNWPERRWGHKMISMGDSLWMMGGYRLDTSAVDDELWEWRGPSQGWRQIPRVTSWPPARRGHSLVPGYRAFFLFGGESADPLEPVYFGDVWRFDLGSCVLPLTLKIV